MSNVIRVTFNSIGAMRAASSTWLGWNKPSHEGYSTAGRAFAAMMRDAHGWKDGQKLAAVFDGKRWHAFYAA